MRERDRWATLWAEAGTLLTSNKKDKAPRALHVLAKRIIFIQ
jgi:hypothetical protein